GARPERRTDSRITAAPSCGAGVSLREPPNVPIAVRTGEERTTSRVAIRAPIIVYTRIAATIFQLRRRVNLDEGIGAGNPTGTIARTTPQGAGGAGDANTAADDQSARASRGRRAFARRGSMDPAAGRLGAPRAGALQRMVARRARTASGKTPAGAAQLRR